MIDSCLTTVSVILLGSFLITILIYGVSEHGAAPIIVGIILFIVLITVLLKFDVQHTLKRETKEDFRMDHPELETSREVLFGSEYNEIRNDFIRFINGFKREHGHYPDQSSKEFESYFSEKLPLHFGFYRLLWVAILAESEADVSDKKSIAREFIRSFFRFQPDIHLNLYTFADEGGRLDREIPQPNLDSYRAFHILLKHYVKDVDLRESRELLREAYHDFQEQKRMNKLQKIRRKYIEPPD